MRKALRRTNSLRPLRFTKTESIATTKLGKHEFCWEKGYLYAKKAFIETHLANGCSLHNAHTRGLAEGFLDQAKVDTQFQCHEWSLQPLNE